MREEIKGKMEGEKGMKLKEDKMKSHVLVLKGRLTSFPVEYTLKINGEVSGEILFALHLFILVTHLSNSLIFFSLSFFSFSVSLRISSSRSTSDWAFPASSLCCATSCSKQDIRLESSTLAWASAAAFWVWNRHFSVI